LLMAQSPPPATSLTGSTPSPGPLPWRIEEEHHSVTHLFTHRTFTYLQYVPDSLLQDEVVV
jgi:hypothetical protein